MINEPDDRKPLESPRLAAVVFTDVVGYSARMQRNEGATIAGVQSDFAQMREACEQRGGEVLNTMGDGMMLCFASAVQAVTFSLEVQREFGLRNSALAAGEGLEHRVGIHLGDVFRVEGGHVAGDGVNIAARLESKAPVGGVCISQTVYDTVKGKVAMRASFMGPQAFKNIAEPIPIWHLMPEGTAGLPTATVLATPKRNAAINSKRSLLVGTSALLALAAGGGVYWWRGDRESQALASSGAAGTSAGGSEDNKSIAVLPFTNMSADKDTAYFADGIHDDLLTQLALLSELKVVSRTSVMDYRNSGKNMRQIGKELGVGSLVEGSVRRAGNQVRITAQLIDARSDKHLWANNYDRELKDIFALQSELATSIAGALRISLSSPEQLRLASKPTENLEAYDLFLRHQELVNNSAGTVRAISGVMDRVALLVKAVELDPRFALAWARLAAEHGRARGFGFDTTPARQTQARLAMDRALALAPDDLQIKTEEGAFLLHAMDDQPGALRAYGQVLKTAPNNVPALYGSAEVNNELGQGAESVAALERVLSVDARHGGAMNRLAITYSRYRHFDRALALKRRLVEARPDERVLHASYYTYEYWATGSWSGYDKWRQTLPQGVEYKSVLIRNLDADRAIARRDFTEVKRLISVDSEDFKRTDDIATKISLIVAQATLALAAADRPGAEALARSALPLLDAGLKKDPEDSSLHHANAQLLAVLRQREAALDASATSLRVSAKSGNLFLIHRKRGELAEIHALLGERELAIDAIKKRLLAPGTFIHDLRVHLNFASVWDDPAFIALVNDPSSNAPLPLTLKI